MNLLFVYAIMAEVTQSQTFSHNMAKNCFLFVSCGLLLTHNIVLETDVAFL